MPVTQKTTDTVDTDNVTPDRSNSLTDLAARIRGYHEATVVALGEGLKHSMAAGDLLIEAKAQLKHGEWLPWLAENCKLSERSAQLYMRCARNRKAIEEAKSATIADLTLSEAAALLVMSSDVRKLFEMAKNMEGLRGEELVSFCAANDVAMITNPFGVEKLSDEEALHGNILTLFLATTCGFSAEGADYHVGWIQSRGTTVAEWMRPDPILDAWRQLIPESTFAAWRVFLDENRARTNDDVEAELAALDVEDKQAALRHAS